MNLEKLNNEYMQLKKDLEVAQKDSDKLENNVEILKSYRMINVGKLNLAKNIGNSDDEKNAEQEIEKIDNELKQTENEASKKKEELEAIKEKINSRIKDIKDNPEMKKHLDEVMSKKYERKISKLEKEKEETVEKKNRLTDLKQLVADHHTLSNNLKGILSATNEVKKLKEELAGMSQQVGNLVTYTDPTRANEIINTLLPAENDKLSTNKNNLMAYISKNGLNITEKDIDDLADKGFTVDGKGNIDLDATMNKNISSLNRQIKGYDKSIKNHQIALENIDNRRKDEISNTRPDPITTFAPEQINFQEPTTHERPKWYQFVQRFKNWNERRKQQRLPEPKQQQIITEPPVTEPTITETKVENKFKNSLKYEIVNDIVEQDEKEDLKQAKREAKGMEPADD